MKIFLILLSLFLFQVLYSQNQPLIEKRLDKAQYFFLSEEFQKSDSIYQFILASGRSDYYGIAYAGLGLNAISQLKLDDAEHYLSRARSSNKGTTNKKLDFLIQLLTLKIAVWKGLYEPVGDQFDRLKTECENDSALEKYFGIVKTTEAVHISGFGNYTKALICYEEAAEFSKNHNLIIQEIISWGNCCMTSLAFEEVLRAEKYLMIAQKLLDSLPSVKPFIKDNLNCLRAEILQQKKNEDGALKIYDQIIEKNQNESSEEILFLNALTYMNIGRLKVIKYEFLTAKLMLEKAHSILVLNFPEKKHQLTNFYFHTGFLYYKQGEIGNRSSFDTARYFFSKAIEIAGTGPKHLIPLNDFYIARCMDMTKTVDETLHQLKVTIQDYKKYLPEEEYKCVPVYLYYLSVLAKNEMEDDSHQILEKSEKIMINKYGIMHPQLYDIYRKKQVNEFWENNFYSSIAYGHKALLISTFNHFNDTNIFSFPQKNLEQVNIKTIDALYNNALIMHHAYLNLHDTSMLYHALDAYLATIRMTEVLRNNYMFSEGKIEFSRRAAKSARFAAYVSYLLYTFTHDQKYKETTFQLMEKCKVSVLNSQLRNLQAQQIGNIPDSLVEKERRITASINFYNDQIYNNATIKKENLQQYEDSLLFYLSGHRHLKNYIENNFPGYRNFINQTEFTKISDVRRIINKDEVLVEYLFTEGHLLTFTISKDSSAIYNQPVPEGMVSDINTLRTYLETYNPLSGGSLSGKEFAGLSRELYRILFENIEGEVNHKNLLIIPDMELNLIPLEILLTEDPVQFDFHSLPYLIKKNAISYSYAASLLLQKTKKKRRTGLLAVAPIYEVELNEKKGIEMYDNRNGNSFKNLPGAQDEVNTISKIYHGRKLTGKEATETAFLKKMDKYNILHLAMHTVINNDYPMYSKLIFAKDTTGKNDGFLNTYELYNHPLDANLVVLSACNTGFGKLLQTEGVMSLARGFIYAGVPNLVLTLWSIPDYSSKELMVLFYKFLKGDYSSGISLQKARLEYLRSAQGEKAHPYYWSGFVSMGGYGESYGNTVWPYYLIFILVAAVFTSAYFIERKTKKGSRYPD